MDNDIIEFRNEIKDALKEVKSDIKEIRTKQDKHAWFIAMGMGMMILTGWYMGKNNQQNNSSPKTEVIANIGQYKLLVSK